VTWFSLTVERFGSSVDYGSNGYYWSSSPCDLVNHAYFVYFDSGNLNPNNYRQRYHGFSVRLVRPVE
jgi:hypothetical protein